MMTDQIDLKLLENNCFEDLILKAVVQILNNVAAVFWQKLNLLKPEWFMAILLDIINYVSVTFFYLRSKYHEKDY